MICLDNFFTGSKRNIEHLIGHPRFELLRHDVTFLLYGSTAPTRTRSVAWSMA